MNFLKYVTTFLIVIVLWSFVDADVSYAGSCSVQSDCKSPLVCLAMNGVDYYSFSRSVRPAIPCELSSNDCICMQPGSVMDECNTINSCDSSKRCTSYSDCPTGQFCFTYDTAEGWLGPDTCSSGDAACTCAISDKFQFEICGDSSSCEPGERCAKLEELYSFKCINCVIPSVFTTAVLEYAEAIEPPSCSAADSPSPTPTNSLTPVTSSSAPQSPSPSASAVQASDTATSTEDPDSTESRATSTASEAPSPSSSTAPPSPSMSTVQPSTSAVTTTPIVNSGSDNAEAESADPNVCIDVKSLSEFQSHQLVFSQHRRASVLCDPSGSCATAGHMVTFNGIPMSMFTYCSSHVPGQCTRTVRDVNSPRMRTGLRIQSSTEGLQFTSFSAAYQSKAEEWVLSKLLQFGA